MSEAFPQFHVVSSHQHVEYNEFISFKEPSTVPNEDNYNQLAMAACVSNDIVSRMNYPQILQLFEAYPETLCHEFKAFQSISDQIELRQKQLALEAKLKEEQEQLNEGRVYTALDFTFMTNSL